MNIIMPMYKYLRPSSKQLKVLETGRMAIRPSMAIIGANKGSDLLETGTRTQRVSLVN